MVSLEPLHVLSLQLLLLVVLGDGLIHEVVLLLLLLITHIPPDVVSLVDLHFQEVGVVTHHLMPLLTLLLLDLLLSPHLFLTRQIYDSVLEILFLLSNVLIKVVVVVLHSGILGVPVPDLVEEFYPLFVARISDLSLLLGV